MRQAGSNVQIVFITGFPDFLAVEENKKLPKEDRFLRIYIGQKNTQFYLAFTNAAGKKRGKNW